MAYSSTDLANLDRAIASGVLESEIDGVRTRFRNLEEMLRIRSLVAAEVGTSAGAAANRATLLSFRQG